MIGEGFELDQIKKLLSLLKENLSNTGQGLKEVPPNILDEVNKCPTNEELKGYLFNALSLHKEICLEVHFQICQKCYLRASQIRSKLNFETIEMFLGRPKVQKIFAKMFAEKTN